MLRLSRIFLPARLLYIGAAGLLLLLLRPAFAAETNHNFARWEGEIAAYENSDRTNPPPKGGILFIGSSSIARWKTLARDFPGLPVLNRGVGGSEIVDATHFAERIIFPYEPRMILLRAGGNDLHAGKSPAEVCADFAEFVRVVRSRLPRAEIVYISLCPNPAWWTEARATRKLDDLIRDFIGGRPRLSYIETYNLSLDSQGRLRPELFVEDRLHLNDQGYALLADLVRPILR